jgi:hypothetical protein
MGRLIGVGVQNLRSLRNTGLVELKPISVLVGRNSAGKSTFARVLPLLRQTAEVRKREPILWWGRFVDFGSYTEAVSKQTEAPGIAFHFQVFIEPDTERNSSLSSQGRRRYVEKTGPGVVDAKLILRESSSKETEIDAIHISVRSDIFVIHFGVDGNVNTVKVNDFVWEPSKSGSYTQRVELNSVFPTIEYLREFTRKLHTGEDFKGLLYYDALGAAVNAFVLHHSLVHGNTAAESIWDITRNLEPWDEARLLDLMRILPNAPPSWKATAATLTLEDYRFKGLRDRLLAARLDGLLRRIDEAVAETASECAYIEPLRATAERYYRKQGLSVDEVDSKGANVPFFLESLNRGERESFDDWMMTHLQTTVYTSTEGGQLSIKIKDKSGVDANLADVGFGFSQLLPVALQLWVATRRTSKRVAKRRGSVSVVVIEQPELHLHPEYQARIADLCAAVASKGNVKLILETHSPSFVNRLGILVSEGKIPAADLQVLRFEKGDTDPHTVIHKSEFDETGRLQDWPYGFFDAA